MNVTIQMPGDGPAQWAMGLRIMFMLTAVALVPAVVLVATSFTRIVIVLSFLRTALGLQQSPSSQVLVLYSLFLTFFIMQPVWTKAYDEGLRPFMAGELAGPAAWNRGSEPLRQFLLQNTGSSEILLFYEVSGRPRPAGPDEVGLEVLLPAYLTSELRAAFQMGAAVLIPFLVIDLVVASILTSLGMMMLPPVMVSLPLKIVMFLLAGGWELVVRSLIRSFAG